MSNNISVLSSEKRRFSPPKNFVTNFSENSWQDLYTEADRDFEAFWLRQALENVSWMKKPTKKCDGHFPNVRWFQDGITNACYNAIDRHVEAGRGQRMALIWEGEPENEIKNFTYLQAQTEIVRIAHGLKKLGIKRGDRVAITMPMIPELVFTTLACARIGAVHSIIFGGFSADAIRDRVIDAGAKLIVTADGGFRKGQIVPLKELVNKACETLDNVSVLYFRRTKHNVATFPRDHLADDLLPKNPEPLPCEPMSAEDPLFILYTSGSTGKPKGVLHTTGGYLTGTITTTKWVFDLQDNDVYWCTADVGWITGHSYVIYGILGNGATSLIYEGGPMTPNPGRFWDIIDRHKVSIFYTAPTAIRSFMRLGHDFLKPYNLDSLRLLGSVGEPINPEAWIWYYENIGKNRCPIVDTWWQTETGAIMIAPQPAHVTTMPGSATKPLPGIYPAIVDDYGKTLPAGVGGKLVITQPWPSCLRGLWNDPKKFEEVYFSQFSGMYFTGDGARTDENGYYWIQGRIDDVINTAGHRLGTSEVESALVGDHRVAEAAVVGIDHELKGQTVVAYVTVKTGMPKNAEMEASLKDHVVKVIGALARPEWIKFTDALPKTRSGKIMRRLLRDLAQGKVPNQDMTTLEDVSILSSLREYDED